MALIALDVANRVEIVQSIQQLTLVAAEDIVPGAPVRIDTTNGTATNANGTTAAEARVWGIATGQRLNKAGLAVTVIRRGILDGFNFTQAYDAPVYAADTDGRLGDVAGTVSTVIGRVVPGTANLLGVAHDKLLSVEL